MVRDRSHIVNLKRAEGRSNFPISPHMPFFFMRFHLACGGLSPAKDSTHVVVPFPSLHCFLLFVINYFFFFFNNRRLFFLVHLVCPSLFPVCKNR
ncbi:transmembrane protein, putative [Bodo saltans]|uniref:Transmembrane protein, putative n=1 Tax=Bodo saltans TaxID=75058 RepID=A0A0S4JEP1_BODSA|nr:transmembrane protein, putative [Bodo saltans]|eukprot:CUG90054.1 transmembrane protein, putative [Bodo saltans]